MSLLDDVSIVVTPNGYKAGELYAVVPVPTEGAELITNGDFATDTDWNKTAGWTISGGSANCVSGTGKTISQANKLIIGRQYKMTVTVTNYSFGYIGSFGDDFGGNVAEANGTYEIIGTATQTTFGFIAQGGFTGSIDNVSVKEYTAADMDVTRATAATRVDEAGLVNYAEVLGSELAICGDFECASPLTGWTDNAPIGEISIDSGRLKVLNLTNRGRSYRTYTGLTIGKTYEAFVGNTSGDVIGFCHITSGTANNNITLNAPFFFVAGATTAEFQCGVNSTVVNRFTFFDNISLKQNDRDNVPRIDYSGGGCPHILAEPQRTNLITYSEDLTNAFYQTTGIGTITVSTTLSPDGTSYGYIITPTSIATSHYFNYQYGQLTVVIGDEVTYSIFVKPNGYNFIQIASSSGFPARYQNFELTGDGVIGTGDISGKTIEKIGDWYRCSVTETSSGVNPRFLLSPSETALATRNPSYSGNATDGVLGWGVQVEVGSYPTSYIPNFGTAAGVTRNQDIFTRDGIGSLINSTEGVLFLEMAALSNDLTNRSITISDGSTNNIIQILFSSVSNTIRFIIRVGGVGGDNLDKSTSTYTVTDFNKVALKWKQNDAQVWINGTQLGSPDTNSDVPTGLNDLSFEYLTVGNNFYGKVKQLQVYKTALTDEQLIQLTGESGTDFYESYAEMASALTYTIQ